MVAEMIIEGKVTGMAFGGKGILRHEGLVVFCPFTVVGDHITCRIIKQKKGFAEAELVSIKEPSPDRIQPRCPYFGTCGGCQLQHMNMQAQLEYKRQAIEDALQRIGKFLDISVPPIIPTASPWAYRRRIQLQLKDGNILGYISQDNASIVQVNCCPIFIDESEPILQKLQTFIKLIKSRKPADGRVSILKMENSFHVDFHFEHLPDNIEEVITQFSTWKSSGLHAPGVHKYFGEQPYELQLEGFSIKISPSVFLQNHPEESLRIYKEIENFIKSYPDAHVLDLYCGIGLTSLFMGRHVKSVTGIEINKESIRCAKENGKMNGFTNLTFKAEDVEQMITNVPALYDVVLVNPPRTGLTPHVIEHIMRIKPKAVIYVSCMPSTLARDLQLLKGYQIKLCQGFDMFPQTAHVETLVFLHV